MIYPKGKDAGKVCSHPECNRTEGLQSHHIIFRSETRKKIIDEWQCWLCVEHHTAGKESPHQSDEWRQHYRTFLPVDWREKLEECSELRKGQTSKLKKQLRKHGIDKKRLWTPQRDKNASQIEFEAKMKELAKKNRKEQYEKAKKWKKNNF